MPEMTAVILAAGLGVRMGPLGRMVPKGLLEVGGAGLVPQSVDSLRRWGAARILVVTGHLQEQYQEAFAGTDVDLIHNDAYSSTGSLKTLLTALDQVSGPVVLLESDLIYAPQVLDAVRPDADRFLVSSPTHAGDEVYCWVQPADAEGRHPMDVISKDRSARDRDPYGEMIGITCLTAEAVDRMRVVGQEVFNATPGAHYEDGLVALAQERVIDCVRFEDVAWAEMDDEDMLARVREDIWPRIAASRAAIPD